MDRQAATAMQKSAMQNQNRNGEMSLRISVPNLLLKTPDRNPRNPKKAKTTTLKTRPPMRSSFGIFLPPIVTDETRAGERGVSPFERREILSGEGTYDLGHIPRVVFWRSGSALSGFFFRIARTKNQLETIKSTP